MSEDKKKYKIGIITFWDCPNFGTFFQAYALQRIVQSICGDLPVEQVAYSNKKHMDVYYSVLRPSMFKYWLIRPAFYRDSLRRCKDRKEIIKLRRFKEYYDHSIPHTKRYTDDELLKESFDTLILGSDIIWDYSIHFFACDPILFGYSLNCKRIISYAASFGTVMAGALHPDYVIQSLKNLDSISVRDLKSAKIIKEITGKDADIVLDPTLLWDFANDNNVIEPLINYKYAVVYGTYFTKEQIDGFKKYCKNNGYKIVYLDSGFDKCDWCDVFVAAYNAHPFEWCGYIKNAELLLTSTYHGLHFGLIFRKRIIFHATDFMKAKLTDFLKVLKLYDVLVDKSFNEQMRYNWDYDEIYKGINKRKKQSFDFLKNNVVKKYGEQL